MADQETETCENCGRPIGKLETPMLWRGRVVCFDCDGLLRKQANTDAKIYPVPANPPTVHQPKINGIPLCKCGTRMVRKRNPKNSVAVRLVLLIPVLMFVFFGYGCLFAGYATASPGGHIATNKDSIFIGGLSEIFGILFWAIAALILFIGWRRKPQLVCPACGRIEAST